MKKVEYEKEDIILIVGLVACGGYYAKEKFFTSYDKPETQTETLATTTKDEAVVVAAEEEVVLATSAEDCAPAVEDNSSNIVADEPVAEAPTDPQQNETTVEMLKKKAIVVSQNSVVMRGEKYEAEIYMLNADPYASYQVFIGGHGLDSNKYAVACAVMGKRTYTGYIKETLPSGEVNKYPFTGEYQVTEPASYIQADLANVFYACYPNPVSIIAPGVPRDNIVVLCENASLTKKIALVTS